jgi:hypothetical protein
MHQARVCALTLAKYIQMFTNSCGASKGSGQRVSRRDK